MHFHTTQKLRLFHLAFVTLPRKCARTYISHVAGIRNFFNMFMSVVDSWVIFDNSENPRKQVASGGRNADTVIDENITYSKMQSYVK